MSGREGSACRYSGVQSTAPKLRNTTQSRSTVIGSFRAQLGFKRYSLRNGQRRQEPYLWDSTAKSVTSPSGLRNFDPKDLPIHGSFPFDLVTGARLSHWGYDPRREPGRKELCPESGPSFGLDRANEQKRPCKFVGLEDKIRTVAKTGLHALSRSLKMLWQLQGGCMEGMI